MTSRTEQWSARQEVLTALLRAAGAEHHDFRVDLGLGRFWWQDPTSGRPSVVAETKVLGSWALSNRSVLAGWANKSLPPTATISAVLGVPERAICASEGEAWDWALSIAEGAGAHFVYRAPNAQSWIFLGLWSVRTAGPGDAPFAPGPPWAHVRYVLEQLSGPRADAERRTLMRNYGRTFVEDPLRRGMPWEALHGELGAALIRLADEAPDAAALDAGVKSLLARVPVMS